MADRIKVVGYINVADLEPEEQDSDSPTGMTEEAYDTLINDDGDKPGLKVADLEDMTVTVA